MILQVFPGGSGVKNLPVNVGDAGSIHRSERQPTPVFCLGNPMDRGARLQSMGSQSWTRMKQLSIQHRELLGFPESCSYTWEVSKSQKSKVYH